MTQAILGQTSEKNVEGYVKGKFILQALLVLLGVVVFLCTNFISFTYKAVTIDLTGSMVLGSIPYAGSILFLFYGKQMEIFLSA